MKIISTNFDKVPAPPKVITKNDLVGEITLKLSTYEAAVLYMFAGKVAGYPDGFRGVFSDSDDGGSLYQVLAEALGKKITDAIKGSDYEFQSYSFKRSEHPQTLINNLAAIVGVKPYEV